MIKFLLFLALSFFTATSIGATPGYAPEIQDSRGHAVSLPNDLLVYPNPAHSGKITLEMNSGDIVRIRLVNILGKEVVSRTAEQGTTKYILSLENLPDGIYFIRVKSTDNKVIVKKLVIASS